MTQIKNMVAGRTFGIVIVMLIIVAVAAGCTRKERVTFNGVYYKAKAKAVSRDDVLNFAVRVPRVDRGRDGALLAGAHEGKRYCLENAGTSEIDWAQGPDGTGGSVPVTNNTMTFTGTCRTW